MWLFNLSVPEILKLLRAATCSLTILSSILDFNFLFPVFFFFFSEDIFIDKENTSEIVKIPFSL